MMVASDSIQAGEIKGQVERHSSTKVSAVLDSIIFYALLVIIALTAIPYGTVEPWWRMIFECSVFALGALWVIGNMLKGKLEVKRGRLLIPVLLLLIYAFIQAQPLWRSKLAGMPEAVSHMLSADPYETKRFILHLLALTVAGLLLIYTSNQRRLRRLIYVIIGIGVGSAIFGFARQSMQQETGFFLPYLVPHLGYGQFMNADHFAFLMEMAVGLILGLAVGRGVPRKHLLFYMLMVVVMWVAVISSTSRGGIATLLIQVLFSFVLTLKRAPQESHGQMDVSSRWWQRGRVWLLRMSLILCLMIGLVLGIVWMGGEPLAIRLEYTPNEFGKSEVDRYRNTLRLKIWEATWQLIKANPVAGVGFGGYWIAIAKYHNGSGEYTPQQAHNDYLELLASGGIIGTALVVWFIVVFLSRARDSLRSTDSFRRAACLGALTGIFAVAIHSSVDFGLHITINALVFTCLIVIATVESQDEEHKLASEESLLRGIAN